MKTAVVGATGMVGRTFLKLIEERHFPLTGLKLFASPKKAGRKISCKGKDYTLEHLKENCFQDMNIVFFSAGEDLSKKWGPLAVKAGATAIDNSSAFRMQKDTALVVPEINLHHIKNKNSLIANPNCSTIQLVVALHPLKKHFGLESVHVSSYQSLSGAGLPAVENLKRDSFSWLKGDHKSLSENTSAFNCTAQIGSIEENGFSKEENKIINETKKILSAPDLTVTATAVRVPCFNGHGEAVTVNLKKPAGKTEITKALKEQKGLTLLPESQPPPGQNFVNNRDDVYVARLREAPNSKGKSWMMWVCADNLKKGAALNSLQIAESLI